MSLELSNSNSIDCKCSSGFTGCGFLENEIRVGDNYINIEDFNELVLYYLTNTDLESNDKRLKLIDNIKKLHQVDGFNSGNKRLQLKDDYTDNLINMFEELKEDLNKKDFQHICKKCGNNFYGTKVQSHCNSCIYEFENDRLSKMIVRSKSFQQSIQMSEEKLNREFTI